MNGMHTAHVNMAKGFEGNIRHTLIQMCCNIEQCKDKKNTFDIK